MPDNQMQVQFYKIQDTSKILTMRKRNLKKSGVIILFKIWTHKYKYK